ncbi:unnamed protein product [Acanthoscelides obtectus]|uniref:Uncharacterized protein n=1 Tax=Acanthoscelides obtectus TaxID=200917 RepID=A0A9P0NZP9_ACAOB|nr:unnamed protein product [Acanthoscelides obtectus]CAK1648664.1 hypothetical protein AOBTE_LOCUS15811 [Acanthoscelides obtectus]
MNHSKNENSSSPGFVYFNNSNYQSPNDTGDFLSFNNTPPQKSPNNKFSPSGYSSPNSKHHCSPNTFQRTPNFHKSPRKFNLKNTFRYTGGRHSGSRSFNKSSSSEFDSSFSNTPPHSNYKVSSRGNHSQGTHRHNQPHQPVIVNGHDVSMFIDHSCFENPWEELERQLEEAESSIVAAPLDEDQNTEAKEESSTSDNGSSSSEEEEQKNG